MITPGTTELVVIQPTPYCNLDCRYCYLPQRLDRRRMQIATVDAITDFLISVPTIDDPIPIVWHAGEPLVVPRSFYQEAFAALSRLADRNVRPQHCFQTNGTLITDEWCDFIEMHQISVGVSIDGPEILHNLNRQYRDGRGSFDRVMRGVQLLKAHAIPFSVITVLTGESLTRPDAMWKFIEENEIHSIGFNVEEIEGANTTSTLDRPAVEEQYETFFDYLWTRLRDDVRIREIDETRARLYARTGQVTRSSENIPAAILSFDLSGNISTFSPELLTSVATERYPKFTFGNVTVDSFSDFLENLARSAVYADTSAGIAACSAACEYFTVCGGGAPSNKLGELGTLNGTETVACRLRVKALTRVALNRLERETEMALQERNG